MTGNGNGNDKLRTVITSVVATLVAAGIIGGFAFGVDISKWRGHVDAEIADRESTRKDVSTALNVLGQHGHEFQDLRKDVQSLRGELIATRFRLGRRIAEELTEEISEEGHANHTSTHVWTRQGVLKPPGSRARQKRPCVPGSRHLLWPMRALAGRMSV